MVTVGNHLKMNVPHELRERTREFYAGLLKCKPMASPSAGLDLYEFDGGFVLGLFFGPATEVPLPKRNICARPGWSSRSTIRRRGKPS